MSVIKRVIGKTPEGEDISLFTLANTKGMKVEILDFGCIVYSVIVPDRLGKFDDIILGYGDFKDYLEEGSYFGALIGRFANRIEASKFELNGIEYKLYNNDGANHLHGGLKGFDKVLWEAEIVHNDSKEGLQLTYLSIDGEEGYPGNLEVKVTHTITEDNALEMNYVAVSDKDTIINLTNHSYFNLSGHASSDILEHQVMLRADNFTPTDKYSIPTGELKAVAGTPMDFNQLVSISKGIQSDYEQIQFANGYDHNWVLNVNGEITEIAAEVYEKKSGRVMDVYTNKPGVQLYTANFLDGSDIGKGGVKYHKHSGLCLETQFFPNSINHKHFPSPVFRAGQKYDYTTIYKFSVK